MADVARCVESVRYYMLLLGSISNCLANSPSANSGGNRWQAERNMNKLKQYRNFYIAVVAIFILQELSACWGVSVVRKYILENTYWQATAFFYFMSGKAFRPITIIHTFESAPIAMTKAMMTNLAWTTPSS